MVRWHRSKVNFHGTCSSWKGYVETAHILHFQLYIREAAVPPQASRRSRQTRSWAVDSQNPPSPWWRRPSWTAGRSCWTCCWWKIWPFLRNPTSSPPRLRHITVPARWKNCQVTKDKERQKLINLTLLSYICLHNTESHTRKTNLW